MSLYRSSEDNLFLSVCLVPVQFVDISIKKYPLKGDTIQYIYIDSKHDNPLYRVIPIENLKFLPRYDKEKYKEMILDAAEQFLGSLALTGEIKIDKRRYPEVARHLYKSSDCMNLG